MKRRLPFVNRLRSRSGACALVLLYHHIAELSSDPWQLGVSARNFHQQMRLVREAYHPVSLGTLSAVLRRREISRLPVVVTFDDGYADNLYAALPVLEEFEIPATFFVTTGCFEQEREFWWDELDRIFLQPGTLPPILRLASDAEVPTWYLADAAQYTVGQADEHRHWYTRQHPPTLRHEIYLTLWERLYRMTQEQRQSVLDEILTWAGAERSQRPTHRRLCRDEVVTLSRGGLVEIGAHTVSHAALPTLSIHQREQEIGLSRHVLAKLVDRPVTSFAFPHGDYCPQTIRLVREAGFLWGCTTRSGLVRPGQDDFQLPRFGVGNWDGNEFAKHLATWMTDCQD